MKYLINSRIKNVLRSSLSQNTYCPKSKNELVDIIRELFDNGIYDLNCINTEYIDDMAHLFENIDYIDAMEEYIDVSEWNVSNVEITSELFANMTNFNCDLSKWDISNIEYANYMFYNCINFNSDLSNWRFDNLKDGACMLYNCRLFNSNVSKWNMSCCQNAAGMFLGCHNFTGDGLDFWDVSEVDFFTQIFYNCTKLNCNLENWKVKPGISNYNMFGKCLSMKKLPSWYK